MRKLRHREFKSEQVAEAELKPNSTTPKNEFSALMLFPGIKGVLCTGLSEELAS